jgi:hypothetical protein
MVVGRRTSGTRHNFALTAPMGVVRAIITSRSSALNKSAKNTGDYQRIWKFRRYLLS